ncbi:MAG: hypothetical protein VX642_01040, partial [Bdellovibrionota bacterium]|nr:hypothetical protein [Bdellovibrionota bacterium]
GFQGERVYLYKEQIQIGELNGYSFMELDSHFEAIEKEFKSRGIFKRSRSFLVSSLVTYLGNSLLLGNFIEIGSVAMALVLGAAVQIHNSAEQKERFKSLLEIRNSLMELEGSPASRVYREKVVGLGEAMAKLQNYHHRVKNSCKNSASR